MKLRQDLSSRTLLVRSLVVTGVMMLLGCAQSITAQWSPIASPTPSPGTNIYYNSGNVGIGTSSPTYKLQIIAPSGTTALGLSFNNGTEQGFQITNTNTGGKTWSLGPGIGSAAGTFGIYNASDALLGFAIDPAGKVGIGTAPEEALHIGGNATIKIGGTYAAGIRQTFVGGVGAQLVLGEYYGNTTFIPRMTIVSGNVGIGTTVPFAKLLVNAGTNVNWGIRNASGVAQFYSVNDANSAYVQGRIDADPLVLNFNSGGNVGIGTTPTSGYKLDVNGNIKATGSGNIDAAGTITGNNIVAKYQDVAEWVPTSEQIPAGSVVVLDATKSNQVISSTQSYDTRVAGVISEQPGLALGESGVGKVLVATTGRVMVKVDASRGAIHVGDLLVTSDIPGSAMKSEPLDLGGVQLHRPGTLIGKALEPLEKGSGRILVLLSLQ